MECVRDRLWLWGHEAGSHNREWRLPGTSHITEAEAASYLGIPNLLMVRYGGKPVPPYDQYAVPLKALKRVVWSIVGAGGTSDQAEQDHVLDLSTRLPNMTGVIMDDFFRKPSGGEDVGVLGVEVLTDIHRRLSQLPRPLDLWVVLYDHQLDLPVQEHLALCDTVTFWTWEAKNLKDLKRNFEAAEKLAPKARKILGCYLWDYGAKQPIPQDLMEMQCETGLQWLHEGRIEGMILLASCICDLGLESVG